MADVRTTSQDDRPLFTCLSCSIAFLTAEEQRDHYRSDHHRYNMKRRVASLPPVSVAIFNQKVLERKQETAVAPSLKGSTCEICNKTYTTENAYQSHVLSKKHRENEVRALSRVEHPRSVRPTAAKAPHLEDQTPRLPPATAEEASQTRSASGQPDADGSEDESDLTLDEKIAAARARLSSAHCLFCAHVSSSLDDNLAHMSGKHSFFIPDAEYLVDQTGLILYLGEKVAVGYICIYCNGRGREFHTLDAVRKHMVDKSHCKIAYDTENDMLEISDYYDFSSSYPDAEERRRRKEEKRRAKREKNAATAAAAATITTTLEAAGEWEDVDDDSGGEVDEVVDEPPSSSTERQQDEDDDDDDSSSATDSLPENQITIGDSHLELVLPSGSRIGHRTMRRYYAQSSSSSSRATHGGKPEDPNSGRAIVRRLLADRHKSALVPRKGGGFGAFGAGTEVVKARNRGEAREAGRHIREFRDQKRKEDYKTRVSFVHNHQKHYRDPLLQ
ncbi:C2H2 type zinc-finger-domain-containing protein [Lactifluus subvellereus]|nr:C2H2 type zinc-finger-domain-containing protein [Lactifluus subvellereus]